MTDEFDWDNLIVDDDFFLDFEAPVLSDAPAEEDFSNSSPDSMSSWICQIESMLMNDDDQEQQITLESDQKPISDFLADVLVDSPVDGFNSGEPVVNSPVDVSGYSGNGSPRQESSSGYADKESNASDDSGKGNPEKCADPAEVNKDGEDPDDPIAKKRRRQLRNRDAAVKSRERKKTYLKEVEMKSKYLERECMRLGRLLQCVVAENQALRLCLQKGGHAYDASRNKQESAVLLWESLLLGSLLWYLGIICLFPLYHVESFPPETMRKNDPKSVAPSGRGGNESKSTSFYGEWFVKSRRCKACRRCKASRTRMKLVPCAVTVLA